MAVYTAINDAGSFFNTLLYSGNGTAIGSGGNTVTGVGFTQDLTWIKNRNGANIPSLQDTVRGATKELQPSEAAAEATDAESISAFTSDGFNLGDSTRVNGSGLTYASWNWKAGTTTGINLDSADLTPSSYSFNQTSSFSVIAWRGVSATAPNTVPHGLGVKPDMIIEKNITTPDGWYVYHSSLGATKNMIMNTTAAVDTSDQAWNDTEPTTTKFTTGVTGGVAGGVTEDLIAYCFASVQGYSKMGSYTGNGNADGPFVYTGFRPAYLLFKNADGVHAWLIFDNKRLGYNIANYYLQADAANAEDSAAYIDILSNGFKIRTTAGGLNTSGETMIYAAFAESPFVNAEGVPTNAR